MPGFQSFFRFFASFCIGQISHQQHKGLRHQIQNSIFIHLQAKAACKSNIVSERRGWVLQEPFKFGIGVGNSFIIRTKRQPLMNPNWGEMSHNLQAGFKSGTICDALTKRRFKAFGEIFGFSCEKS